jgi:hypothetical protein
MRIVAWGFEFLFAADGGRPERVTVSAAGRHLAVDLAERLHPGRYAVAVVTRAEVLGRCDRCRAVVFDDECDRPGRRVVCVDCG